jgi:uncharacterized protein with PQ loop repeat
MTKIFGWIATGLGLLYKTPQIYKIYKSKKIDGLSLNSYICQSLSYCFYIVHGYYIEDNPTISMGFISLTQNLIIHILFYKFNNKKSEVIDKKNDEIIDSKVDLIEEIIV